MPQSIPGSSRTTSPRASGRARVALPEPAGGWVTPRHGNGLLRPFRPGQVDVERGNTALRQVRNLTKSKSPEVAARLIDIALHDPDTRVAVVAGQAVMLWAFGRPENLKADDGEPSSKLDLSKLTDRELQILSKLVEGGRLQDRPEAGAYGEAADERGDQE